MANCPFCSKTINLNTKAEASIKSLAPGKQVRIKCPSCSGMLGINNKFQTSKIQAPQGTKSPSQAKSQDQDTAAGQSIRPPDAPDLSWLEDGLQHEDDRSDDDEATLALVLAKQEQGRDKIVEAIESLGYQVELVGSATEAIEKMAFCNYAMVALHSRFEGKSINSSVFHQHMQAMRMSSRRYIFYFLIGPEFHTLYELQALSVSANLVVNDREVPKLNMILMKKIPEYERLFGQIIEEIRNQGKSL